MSKLSICFSVVFAVLSCVSGQSQEDCQWSPWVDRDDPSATGDWENFGSFVTDNKRNGRWGALSTCFEGTVVKAECRNRKSKVQYHSGTTSHKFKCNKDGYVCKNRDNPLLTSNPKCPDAEVRFCCKPKPIVQGDCQWSSWVDRDDPTATGDWETYGSFAQDHKRNGRWGALSTCFEGTVVKAECRNRKSKVQYHSGTKSHKFTCNKDGYVCKNRDNPLLASNPKCPDAEVRFCCKPNTCKWSQWVDRDDPSATGDWENFGSFVSDYNKRGKWKVGGIATCIKGTVVKAECRNRISKTPYTLPTLLHKFTCNKDGYVCKNSDNRSSRSNPKCPDAEVRFCCDP